MGKEKPGFLTPKAIANRIKSKGLQKLRWYCQMCQKQCRDENGFKCHTMSESHQRQLLLFGENANKFMDEFSSEFNREYLNTLKRRFGTKRVHANIVYQEYINDRNHIHMNATRWLTLTDYVKWLGRKGICVVDETEKGWFVTYIDRDPETLRRQEEIEKKKKLDLDDRQRQEMFLQKQMERAKELEDEQNKAEPTELKKSEDEVIKISFKKTAKLLSNDPKIEPDLKIKSEPVIQTESSDAESKLKNTDDSGLFKVPMLMNVKKEDIKPQTSSMTKASSSSTSSVFKASSTEKRKTSALDEIITMDEKKREKMNRKDYWLHKNIVVKIITNKLGEKYYKKKAVIMDVVDLYTAIVKLTDSTSAIIKLDQAHLETVLPALGRRVLVLNGAYRGEQATLNEINEKDFNAKITIETGSAKGRVVTGVQYDDISKLYQED